MNVQKQDRLILAETYARYAKDTVSNRQESSLWKWIGGGEREVDVWVQRQSNGTISEYNETINNVVLTQALIKPYPLEQTVGSVRQS